MLALGVSKREFCLSPKVGGLVHSASDALCSCFLRTTATPSSPTPSQSKGRRRVSRNCGSRKRAAIPATRQSGRLMRNMAGQPKRFRRMPPRQGRHHGRREDNAKPQDPGWPSLTFHGKQAHDRHGRKRLEQARRQYHLGANETSPEAKPIQEPRSRQHRDRHRPP